MDRQANDLTSEKFEGSWPTPPLGNPEHILFLIHVQAWINDYWSGPLSTESQRTNKKIFLTKIEENNKG